MMKCTHPLRYLRYLVYKVKMKANQYKEDAEHYLYDIFVCYSQADRQWVFEHLVARLEDGGRYAYDRLLRRVGKLGPRSVLPGLLEWV